MSDLCSKNIKMEPRTYIYCCTRYIYYSTRRSTLGARQTALGTQHMPSMWEFGAFTMDVCLTLYLACTAIRVLHNTWYLAGTY